MESGYVTKLNDLINNINEERQSSLLISLLF